jgi:type IV pilus assembly protein PilV
VGLLGIAKMQSLALSNTTTSRQRALAAQQAAGLASAMHSNRDYWINVPGPYPYTLTITSAPAAVAAPNDAALQAALIADIASAPNINQCIATTVSAVPLCAPNATGTNDVPLAAFDLARWWVNGLVPMLPNPSTTISCTQPPAGTPGPMACTIQISWSEKAVAMNSQENGQAGGFFVTPTYTLYVEP